MARKTEFELEWASHAKVPSAKISIIGEQPGSKPYVSINAFVELVFIPDHDLERFAVNILKALGSKKLASNNIYRYDPYPNAEGQGVQ